MRHSLAKVWIHAIFGTKNRMPLIVPGFSERLHAHIGDILTDLTCPPNIVNGTEDHVHVLLLLTPARPLSEVMQIVKGMSSHWVNQGDYVKTKFAWQKGYGAFSVSESSIETVRSYIRNQQERHRSLSFQEEYALFVEKYGVEINR